MGEFLQNYGLWILLGGIFVAMHAFGMGCGGHGGHQHGGGKKDEKNPENAGGHKHGTDGQQPAGAGRRAGGCH